MTHQFCGSLEFYLVALTGSTLGLGKPIYASPGESRIFGLGRGEGIGAQLPEWPGDTLGDSLTCSSAWD